MDSKSSLTLHEKFEELKRQNDLRKYFHADAGIENSKKLTAKNLELESIKQEVTSFVDKMDQMALSDQQSALIPLKVLYESAKIRYETAFKERESIKNAIAKAISEPQSQTDNKFDDEIRAIFS